ncbi:hypothetical protein ABZP36_033177 [Zizania latifolia]
MAGAAASPTTTQAHAVAKQQQIPFALVPVAVLLTIAVGGLSLLPSVAQAVWEVPHLVLLGLVISYGVFAQKSSGGDGGGGGSKDDGDRAWYSRYLPDDPLVVVADHAACDDGASERPLSLPVRRLKPLPAPELESEASDANVSDDGIGGETDSSASTAGFRWAGASAGHSPPSVLDAVRSRKSIAATAPYSIKSTGFPCYCPPVSRDQSFIDDGEVTDWDDDEADAPDEMAASSDRLYQRDFIPCGNHGNGRDNNGDDNDRDMSVDEELLELAAKVGTEEEDEVDRKADEFIAKFREQIRLQRL